MLLARIGWVPFRHEVLISLAPTGVWLHELSVMPQASNTPGPGSVASMCRMSRECGAAAAEACGSIAAVWRNRRMCPALDLHSLIFGVLKWRLCRRFVFSLNVIPWQPVVFVSLIREWTLGATYSLMDDPPPLVHCSKGSRAYIETLLFCNKPWLGQIGS